jgi:segregation and condensation protein B
MTDHFQLLRSLEALLFAANEPQTPALLARALPEGADVEVLLEELAGLYGNRGVALTRIGEAYCFRTAPDLAHLFAREQTQQKKLTRAAVEALAIIAYHQPATRAEIEEIRGVALSKGTLDTLLEAGWIQPRGRREVPGRPVTWGTTDAFLSHFGLESLNALPGVEELKAAGLLDTRPAVTALAERGLLGPMAGGEGSLPPAIEEVAEDESEPLAEDFGEALLDEETAGPGSDAALEDEPAAGEGVDGEEEDGGDDDGGERRDP